MLSWCRTLAKMRKVAFSQMRNAVLSAMKACGLAYRADTRYKAGTPGGEGDTGAVARYRGFSVIDIAGLRVALYARHSTDAQDRSVPAQLERCRAVATRSAATVVEEFVDTAITGAVMEQRPAVMALLTSASYGGFDAVLVEDLSRVSRDQADIATIFKRLSYHGVAMVSITEGPISEIHIGLKGTMNAIFLKDLADKVRRGQYAAAANGSIPGGTLYGYDVEGAPGTRGRRIINEVEAAIVRRIFAETAAGRPYREIARALNADGIPSPRGAKWSGTTIAGVPMPPRGILRNPIYRGRIVFGRTTNVLNPVTGTREVRLLPKSEWQTIEAPELAIVTPDQWDAAQAILETIRRGRPRRERQRQPNNADRYITSARIRCGDCGDRVTTEHSGWLTCRTWRQTRACTQRHLFRRVDVIRALTRLLASPRHAKAVHAAVSAEADARAYRAGLLRMDLAEVERAAAVLTHSAAALSSAAEAQPDHRQAIRDLAIPVDELDALANRITTTRDALALLEPGAPVDAIAAAAHARIANAARMHTGERDDPDSPHTRLLRTVLERITVAWRGRGRKRLTVTATLAAPAVYDLGRRQRRPPGG